MHWQSYDTQSVPGVIVERFREECFPDRTIDSKSFQGRYRGMTYAGRFKLTDGIAWYRITRGPHMHDSWEITRED